jgi:AbrB family looped-hinge helix DNA binding protein
MAHNDQASTKSESVTQVVLSEGGRIVIPASVRKALGVGPGDALTLRVEGSELRLMPQREAVRRAQAIVARRVARGRSLVKELREERKREATRG